MRKNDQVFFTPQRQPPIAILVILVKFLRNLVRQLWPLLLVLVLNRGSQIEMYIGILALALSVISGLGSVLAYFRFTYYIEGDELIIEKGVLSRKKVNVPFDRIQSVNFEQGIVHQAFDVVGIKFETAGSKKSEVVIDALYKKDATHLRDFVLSQRTPSPDTVEEAVTDELVFSLKYSDLLKIGISQNHIETIGILVAWSQ